MKTITRTATGILIPVFCLLFCGCYSYWKALFGVLIITSPFISYDMQCEDEEYDFIGISGFRPVASEEIGRTDESESERIQTNFSLQIEDSPPRAAGELQSINNDMQFEVQEQDDCAGTSVCLPAAAESTCEQEEPMIIIEPVPVYSQTDAPCSCDEPACSAEACPVNTDSGQPAVQTDSGRGSNERRGWTRR
ncbi:hypothetical protein JW906_08910 [bacterium]|nr:hypothetical protein [bacterium]